MFIGQWDKRFGWLGLRVVLLLGVLAMPALAEQVDDGFMPDFDGVVRAIDVNAFDGKVIAVGEFSSVDGQARVRLVRLNTDGSVDTGFAAPLIGGEVFAAASYYDGRVVIAGRFNTVNGMPRTGIARLNVNGSLDAGFAPVLAGSSAPDGVPVGLALHVTRQNELLLGGWFGSVDGKAHERIVRFNAAGAVDDGFNASLDDVPRGFTELRSNELVIHGDFNVVNGEPRMGIAKLGHDGALVELFAPAPDSHVVGVALQADDNLVVSGSFEHIAGVARHGIARISVHGELDASYAPDGSLFGADGVGPVVLQRDGKLWVATRSCPVLGASRCDSLVRLNPDGSMDAAVPRLDANEWISSLAMQSDGKLVFGGAFTLVGNASPHRLARLNRDGSLDDTTRTYANGSVRSIATLPDGGLILGGTFSSVNLQSRRALAKLHPDGSLDLDFHPNLASPVGSGDVRAVNLLPDGRMIVAGVFQMVNGSPVVNIARLHADGSQDSSFVGRIGGTDPYVSALLPLPDGGMLVGGKFDLVNGVTRANLVKLDADGNLDASFVDAGVGTVTALARQTDGSFLAGVSTMNSSYRHLVRLNPDGSWDTGWQAHTAHVGAIVVQPDGKIIVAGSTDIALSSAPMQRLNSDGSRDTSFAVTVEGVETMLLRPDGSLILGGRFGLVNGQVRNRICRVDRNGTLDPDFDPDTVSGAVHALAMQLDGKLAVGGEFTTLGGQSRYYFGRLSAPDLRAQEFYFVPYIVGGSVINWSGMPHAGVELDGPPMLLARPEGASGFSEIGAMHRTTYGWRYIGYMPPFDRNVDLRVQARPRSGQANGSSGLLESTLRVYVSGESNPDLIFADDFE